MKTLTFIRATAVGALVLSHLAYADVSGDVTWCLTSASKGGANSTILKQATPFPRAMCKAFLAGDYFTGGVPLEGIQQDWARNAAKLSCSGDIASQHAAVTLVAACQCHNEGLATRIMGSDRVTVIHVLRQYQGCDSLGLPIF